MREKSRGFGVGDEAPIMGAYSTVCDVKYYGNPFNLTQAPIAASFWLRLPPTSSSEIPASQGDSFPRQRAAFSIFKDDILRPPIRRDGTFCRRLPLGIAVSYARGPIVRAPLDLAD